MSRSGKSGGGRRAVTPDEAALWDHATRTLSPVKAKARVTEAARSDPSEPSPPQPPAKKSPPARAARPPPAPPTPRPAAAARRFRSPPGAPHRHRQAEIEARIDLHGLRQSDAAARLRAFLFDAHARGLKTVLVITGKGGEAPRGDYMAEAFGEKVRGVLRRSVPGWLDGPELRTVVLGYTTAGVRHGGEGALYVQLRRPARRGDGDG